MVIAQSRARPLGVRHHQRAYVESCPPGQRSDAEWNAEIERRHAEIERGEVVLVPGPEALAELKEEFS